MKTVFMVKMSPIPHIGHLMRQADLCDGVSVTKWLTAEWKEGEVVDEARIEKVKAKFKETLEEQGYDVYLIELIKNE
jgi:hypothetical protein